jgi:molecular chaperone GrpE (heat shock protein)
MKIQSTIDELGSIIDSNLLSISNLKNQIEQKELEKQDLLKEIALGIMDAIDSVERLEEGLISDSEDDENLSISLKRYQIIRKKLTSLLQKYGITKIEFPDNRLIVGLCEVIEIRNDDSKENDEIVSIVKNGYLKGEELIRPAQIIIVKNGAVKNGAVKNGE